MKQQQGIMPSQDDVAEFERLKGQLLAIPVAANFIEAEDAMQEIFKTVTTLLQKTLQLGRVPTAEDLGDSECCNEGGCGCH